MSAGNPLTAAEKVAFVKKLKATNGNVSKASQAIKRSRNVLYEHKKSDADFAQEWENALEVVYDSMEEEMYRRAVRGVKKPMVSRGQIVKDDNGKPIIITEYSDRLLEFALKGNRPEKFRDRLDVNQNISGNLDVNIETTIDLMYDDDQPDSPSIAGDAETD
jgi:hypothetical protein